MSTEVRQMFSSIATRYDVTNEVLSFGIHRLWRRKAVRLSGAQAGSSVLDCATGTGDLALAFKRKVGATGRVVGTDFCKEMLDHAPGKAERQGLAVEFQVADAMALPFADNSFDVASIAFGIRNVDDPVKCLKEMARVVRPGGRVVVLEFGQPTGLFGALFRFYSKVVMPAVGGLLTGNRAAYEYLPRTSAAFPAGEKFLELDGALRFLQGKGGPFPDVRDILRLCRDRPLNSGSRSSIGSSATWTRDSRPRCARISLVRAARHPSPTQTVVIGGHRAAGKTRLLPLVSALLGRPGLDLDVELERRTGRTLRDWVAQDADGFRAAERALFQELPAGSLIAVGGGFLSHHPEALHSCYTLLVPVSFETYRERLLHDTHRPRLRVGMSIEDELHSIYHQRAVLHARVPTVSLGEFLRACMPPASPAS